MWPICLAHPLAIVPPVYINPTKGVALYRRVTTTAHWYFKSVISYSTSLKRPSFPYRLAFKFHSPTPKCSVYAESPCQSSIYSCTNMLRLREAYLPTRCTKRLLSNMISRGKTQYWVPRLGKEWETGHTTSVCLDPKRFFPTIFFNAAQQTSPKGYTTHLCLVLIYIVTYISTSSGLLPRLGPKQWSLGEVWQSSASLSH